MLLGMKRREKNMKKYYIDGISNSEENSSKNTYVKSTTYAEISPWQLNWCVQGLCTHISSVGDPRFSLCCPHCLLQHGTFIDI